ncbi:MAG: MCE family protein [Flavobacterium sp.]|nr:MAG: MCE family protein [Flavobacterium sp.]
MKQTSSEKFRLGIFVVLGALVFVLAIYFIGRRQSMFGSTMSINAVFNNINGLQIGNNVRYAGIDIGTVKGIEMVNDTTIVVNMVIQNKIVRHVKRNAVATISSDGLVGSMIVNIIPGNNFADPISDNDTIKSFSRIRTDDILNTLNVTNENAALLTADLLKITRQINEGHGTVGTLLRDTVMANNLRKTLRYLELTGKTTSESMKKVDRLIGSLNQRDNVVGVLNDTAVASRLRRISVNLEKSTAQIDVLMANLNETVTNARDGKGAINYLSNNPELVTKIDSILTNANEAGELLKQDLEAAQQSFLLRGYFKKKAKR